MSTDAPPVVRLPLAARSWCLAGALALSIGASGALGQTLASKAKESGCVDKPKVVAGSTYRCTTSSGFPAYFNVPDVVV